MSLKTLRAMSSRSAFSFVSRAGATIKQRFGWGAALDLVAVARAVFIAIDLDAIAGAPR